MEKQCPFFKADCLKEKCQLWIEAEPTNPQSCGCAISRLAEIANRDLPEIAKNTSAIAFKS